MPPKVVDQKVQDTGMVVYCIDVSSSMSSAVREPDVICKIIILSEYPEFSIVLQTVYHAIGIITSIAVQLFYYTAQ